MQEWAAPCCDLRSFRKFRHSQDHGLAALRADSQMRKHFVALSVFQSVFDKRSQQVNSGMFDMNRLPRFKPLLQDVAHSIQTASIPIVKS
jgi:hypothetical protein